MKWWYPRECVGSNFESIKNFNIYIFCMHIALCLNTQNVINDERCSISGEEYQLYANFVCVLWAEHRNSKGIDFTRENANVIVLHWKKIENWDFYPSRGSALGRRRSIGVYCLICMSYNNYTLEYFSPISALNLYDESTPQYFQCCVFDDVAECHIVLIY